MSLELLADNISETKAIPNDNIMRFDSDKRIDIHERRILFQDNETKFDFDKRIDMNENKVPLSDSETCFDPDKRIDIQLPDNCDIVSLTDEQRAEIKEKTGWSDDVLDNMRSSEEAEIYIKAGLTEVEIGGKKCLIREDIDWDQKDEKGRTNSERIQRGLSPLDKEGNAIELHHIGQHADSPLAELTHEDHRCHGNDTVLHDKSLESEVHGEGNNWSNERQDYWRNRSVYNEGGND